MPDTLSPEIRSKAIGQTVTRSMSVGAVNAEARTVEFAFSSENPVERWYGLEILDHAPGSCRLGRLKDSGPHLVMHDWDDQVGVIEDARVDVDKKGRVKVRFGKSARAEEIFQDVAGGIRKHVSVSYIVHDMRLESETDGVKTYRITDWEPLETSTVSVPADHTVGVGRSLEVTPNHPKQETRNMPDPVTPPAAPAPVTGAPAVPTVAQERANEVARTKAIRALAAKFKRPDLADAAVESGATEDEFTRTLLDASQTPVKPLGARSDRGIGMQEEEVKRFSFVRLLNHLSQPENKRARDDAAFEREMCEEAASKRSGPAPKGVLVPLDVLVRNVHGRAMSTDTTNAATNNPSTAGVLIANDLLSMSFIDLLRNKSVLMGMGTRLTGLVGTLDIPKQISGSAVTWIGEDDDAEETALEFGLVSMAPKTLAARTEMTRRLLMQSSLDVEAMVRRDLAVAIGLEIDRVALYGTGASNQPKGVAIADGITVIDFAGANPTWAEVVAMETALASDNADIGDVKTLLSPASRGYFKTTVKAGTEQFIMGENGNSLNGYSALVSNQVTGGPTPDIFHANWSDLLIGAWGGLDLLVDPYTKSEKARLRVVVHQDVDVAVRRGQSFVRGYQATP